MEKTKLPEDFKAKWCFMLREGGFKKCETVLHEDGCFCVLGVGGLARGLTASQLDRIVNYEDLGLGLTMDEHEELYLLNDVHDMSLPELADYIEQNH